MLWASLPLPVKKALLHPSLQPYNLSLYTLCLIIDVQHTNTTPGLAAAISSASWIKEQKTIVFPVPGDVAMSEDDTAGIVKLASCYLLAIM